MSRRLDSALSRPQNPKHPLIEEKLERAAVFAYDKMLRTLHRHWKPHKGQIQIGQTLFDKDIRQIFIQCGRKFGKTEIVIYMAWRWALTHPNAACYYISPYQKQSREIVWASHRLQNFGPKELVKSTNNTEMRITLENGSFIKCDGSENYEAYRGITPSFMIYDEFKDFRPEFHIAMAPNLAVENAPLIIIGTPPDKECQYTEIAEEFAEDPNKAWFTMPTDMNPHIDKGWLANEKKILLRRGDDDVWEREYMAKFIRGGRSSIFPMLSNDHKVEHQKIVDGIYRDRGKLKWYCIADPGTTTCFGVLFAAINPFTKEIYILDEIYETDQKKTSVRLVGSQIIEKKEELHHDSGDWFNGRDLAASWFENEMLDLADLKGLEPNDHVFVGIDKRANAKDQHLSIIKDALLDKKLIISDRCVKLFWEMENYVLDDKGKIPKENDHLIDCLRYLIEAEGYGLTNKAEPLSEAEDENFRGATIEQDIRDGKLDEDKDGIRLPIDMEGF